MRNRVVWLGAEALIIVSVLFIVMGFVAGCILYFGGSNA